MNSTINFSWHVLYRANAPLFNALSETPLLRLVEPEHYFNRISASNPTLYHPIDLAFTNLFHLQLRSSLAKRLNASVREKNFPYCLPIKSLRSDCRVSVGMQLFMPDILSLRLTCYTQLPLTEDTAFSVRQLHSHPDLVFLCNEAVKIVSRAICPGRVFEQTQNRPLLKLHIDSGDDQVLTENKTFFAALLINDASYRDSDPAIFKKVLLANEAHNRKNKDSKLILINKQGYLTVTNRSSASNPIVAQEIRKRELMFELGWVLRSFYETYPSIRQIHMREMDYLFFATQPYITDSKLTFSLSYGNTLAWNVIVKSLRLKDAFRSATRFNVDAESKLSNLFDRIPHPRYADPKFWDEVRNILGVDYMANSTGGNNVNIGTMHGSLTMGDNSPAHTMNIDNSNKAELLKIVEQLAQLRQEVAEGANREDFDELIVNIRNELKTSKPDTTRLSKALGALKSLAEGVTSHAIAIGLIHQAGKLLGLTV